MQMSVPFRSQLGSAPRRPWSAPGSLTGASDFDRDWLLALAQHLQVTLRVEGLLEVYATQCAPAVPFDSVRFENAQRQIGLEHGIRGVHSYAYTLVLSEETLGVVTYTRNRPFSESDAERLEFLTSQLVYPLRNALLYHDALVAASRDPLTGISNRGTFEARLEREVSLAQRHGHSLSLVMLDLDLFKRVNDRYGHAAGDCVLRTFASRVARCIRGSDELFRYGGEEFVLVLRSTDLRGAALLAERVREAIAALRVDCGITTLRLTVSAGVASLAPGDDPAALLSRADKALYRSKADGRNRVTAAA
jgi:diguanylate cyclase (GGDEF)-like protein